MSHIYLSMLYIHLVNNMFFLIVDCRVWVNDSERYRVHTYTQKNLKKTAVGSLLVHCLIPWYLMKDLRFRNQFQHPQAERYGNKLKCLISTNLSQRLRLQRSCKSYCMLSIFETNLLPFLTASWKVAFNFKPPTFSCAMAVKLLLVVGPGVFGDTNSENFREKLPSFNWSTWSNEREFFGSSNASPKISCSCSI